MGLMTVSIRNREIPVGTFREAAALVRADIEKKGTPSSRWYGRGSGRVVVDGVQVAFVSYNGRVWRGVDDGQLGHEEIDVVNVNDAKEVVS